jgi:hypothetical protein
VRKIALDAVQRCRALEGDFAHPTELVFAEGQRTGLHTRSADWPSGKIERKAWLSAFDVVDEFP